MIFGCQSSNIHKSEDIHTDIQAGISMQAHAATAVSYTHLTLPTNREV